MADKSKSSSEPRGAAEKAEAKVEAELREVLPLSNPPEAEVAFHEREPDKVIPADDTDGADTPSGHALRQVGAPDRLDPNDVSDKDASAARVQGLRYRLEKAKKRWLA